MAHIDWTDDLATGFQDIDEQHQQMVAYINQLHRDIPAGDPMQTAQTLFDLISCAMNHFAYEEEILEAAGYNLLEVRRNTHANFTGRLLEFQNRIMAGEAVGDELLEQLDAWVFRHIRVNDQGYVATVRAAGLYRQDDQGRWQRIGSETEHTPETAQQDNTSGAQPEAEPAEPQEETPRSWATGSY